MSKNVVQGSNVYDTLHVGDTVVDVAGKPLNQTTHVALNHRGMTLLNSGDVILQGKNIVDDTPITQVFSSEEIDAIRGFLNVIELKKRTEGR